jgi:hypothetical protein
MFIMTLPENSRKTTAKNDKSKSKKKNSKADTRNRRGELVMQHSVGVSRGNQHAELHSPLKITQNMSV